MNRYCRYFNDSTDSSMRRAKANAIYEKKIRKDIFLEMEMPLKENFGGGGGILQYYPKSSMLIFSLLNKAYHSIS